MQLLAPTFAFEFKCIADKCTYSCCKDWSIIFDEDEHRKFLKYGIDDIDASSTQLESDKYEMKHDTDGNCPYLEESGLCHMITSCGHDRVLCNTCETFPRIINPKNDYIEYTLSNACPAVIDILNKTPNPITFEMLNYDDPIEANGNYPSNLIACRDTMIDLMQIIDFPIWLRLYIIYSFASKVKQSDIKNVELLIDKYNSVEYLLKMCNELISIDINLPTKLQLMVNYLAITSQKDSTNIHEKYYVELFNKALKMNIDHLSDLFTKFDNVYSTYSSLMENIAVNDIFRNTNCSSGEDLFYSTIILIIMMSLIKFTFFLEWIETDKNIFDKPDYNIIVYFARKFEHINFNHLKKQMIEFEKQGWLEPGNIFTLLR